MRSGQDGYIRPEHDAVADGDQGAVEDRQVEVGVEPLPDAYVAAVVDAERRLDEHLVVADVAEALAKHARARVRQGAKVGLLAITVAAAAAPTRKPRIVVVTPGSGFEARCF